MNISVNGKQQDVPEGLSVEGLVEVLELDSSRVAIERNRSILRREEWASTMLDEGDSFEVVQFVGGG